MPIIRSFNVNLPSDNRCLPKGGVIAGSLAQGAISTGEVVEIRLGKILQDGHGNWSYESITARVLGLRSETTSLMHTNPCGIICIEIDIEPSSCRLDSLIGLALGFSGQLPPVVTNIKIDYRLLRRLVGFPNREFARSRQR